MRNGKEYDILPFGSDSVVGCEPIYETMPGWSQSTCGITQYADLPQNAKNYLKRIEEIVAVPIDVISTGAERSETVLINNKIFN